MVVLSGLQMHLVACLCFLVPPGFSRIRCIYSLLETKRRDEPVLCKSKWMAQLKLCGSDLMVELVISKSSQCTWKKVLLESASVFLILICFQVFFVLYSLSYRTCTVEETSYSEAFYEIPLAHLLTFEEQQVFPTLLNSVSLLRWSELHHQWRSCTSSEESCGTFARLCVKG